MQGSASGPKPSQSKLNEIIGLMQVGLPSEMRIGVHQPQHSSACRGREYGISSFGESEYTKGGSIVENKLMFLWDGDAGGKPTKFRYPEDHVSPRLYTYKAEASVGKEPWTVIGEGKIAKVK